MWNKWIHSILQDITGYEILELGHGPGHLQIALLKMGKQVMGIDLSPQMGAICAKRILKTQKQPNLVNGSGNILPFPKNSFDQIISTFPTEYIVDPNTINEMYRVLRPGGSFIILPVAWITGKNLFHKTAAWVFKITGQTPKIDNDVYTAESKRFTRAGFTTSFEIRKLKNSQIMIFSGVKTIE